MHQKHELWIPIYLSVGSKKSGILGMKQERLWVGVSAPPVEGKANKALIRNLADTFSIKCKDIHLVQGTRQRMKLIKIVFSDLYALEQAKTRLASFMKPDGADERF